METTAYIQRGIITTIDGNGKERNLLLSTRNSAKRTFTIKAVGFVSVVVSVISDYEYYTLRPFVEAWRDLEVDLNTLYHV